MSQILIYSSEENRIKFLTDCLETQGISYSVRKEEESVYEYLQKNTPDLILVDAVNLKDKVNICRKIKVSTQSKNISILLLADTKQNNSEYLKY